MSQTKAQLVQPVGIVTGTGINVTGVITATSFVGSGEGLTGVASTDNIITGTAATFNNTVQVNSTLTANSGFTTNATNTNLKVTGVGTFAGAVSAASFSGDGSALTGLANTDFINAEQLTVVGVVTAATGNIGNLNITKSAAGAGATVGSFTGVTTYYGDGSNLSGVGYTVAPWNYNPDVNDTLVAVDTGIGITFNQKVLAGSGTATLKIVNANGSLGTTIQSWGVSSCTFNVSGNVQDFALGALVSDLTTNKTYQLDIPSGFIVDGGGNAFTGTAYTFTTLAPPDTLWTLGDNRWGVLGINDIAARSSPVQIPGTTWKMGATAYGGLDGERGFAIRTDGTLWTWGTNQSGAMGVNSGYIQRSSPVQVPGTTWSDISMGEKFNVSVKSDGTLWSWGYNTVGQLGIDNTTTRSSPIQIGSGTDWATGRRKIATTNQTAGAIKTDGTLWMWGNNSDGNLGQNNTTQYSSPKQIPGTTWKSIKGGYFYYLATKTDGTLWGWGQNSYGNLGNNDKAHQSSPIQIPGTTWAEPENGILASYATKTDGTMWAWGRNIRGALGQNVADTPGNLSSPIQIPGTNWSTTGFHGAAHACLAVKTDGTMWAWGDGAGSDYNDGLLGQNSIVSYSSPVQIGSETDWNTTKGAAYKTLMRTPG